MSSVVDIKGVSTDSFSIGKGGPKLINNLGMLQIDNDITAANLAGSNSGDQTISTIPNLQSTLNSKEPSFTILPITKGGTGTNVPNYVDLSTNQSIGGIKTLINTTASNSISTGSLIVNGGLGVAGDINGGGDISFPNSSEFRIYKNATQALVANTLTRVTFQVKDSDTKTEFNIGTNRFVSSKTGRYLFNTSMSFATTTATTRCKVSFFASGVEHSIVHDSFNSSTTQTTVGGTAIINLIAGQFVEVFALCNKALNINLGQTLSYFSGVKLP